MRAIRILLCALVVVSAAFRVAHSEAATLESSVKLGAVVVTFAEGADQIVVQLSRNDAVFAQTTVGKAEVASYTTSDGAAELALKTGFTIRFSAPTAGASDCANFVVLDYEYAGNGVLTFEEPLQWEAVCFEGLPLDMFKSFGTAGLKSVDGAAGSYAFMALVEPETRSGLVGGWITSERAGAVVRSAKTAENALVMIPRLDFGKYNARKEDVLRERFVLGAFEDCRLGLEAYADMIADHYSIQLKKDCIVGYCTWYSDKHGGSSDENAMKELAEALEKDFGDFGLQYVQIDDRWQLGDSKNGPNKNFTGHRPNGPYPSGMKATSDYLNSHGLVAGIWFMPFSGNYNDPWFADKQDLFVRSAIDYPAEGEKNTRRYSSINQKKGEPYETFWGGTCLDTSNPKTREYIRDVVERITQDWNYKFIKIDGMWCGAGIEQLYVNDEYMLDDIGMQILHDPRATNVENFRKGLELVRETAKDTFILGCNVSQNMRILASSYGLVDAMRVGPDNGASWQGVRTGPWRGTNRYFYNARVWYNDPDPVYARTSIPLDRARVSATWAALTGQLYALSDWVPDYDQERVDLVRKTIPNHDCKNVRPVDLFDVDFPSVWLLTDETSGVRRDVVGLFNWSGDDAQEFDLSPEKLGLPLVDANGEPVSEYVAYDFWNDRFVEPFANFKATLPKESCAVYAVRPVGDAPFLLSTSRHVAQCVLDVEKEAWNPDAKELTLVVDVPKKLAYELRVYNPATKELERFVVPESYAGKRVEIVYKQDVIDGQKFQIQP